MPEPLLKLGPGGDYVRTHTPTCRRYDRLIGLALCMVCVGFAMWCMLWVASAMLWWWAK